MYTCIYNIYKMYNGLIGKLFCLQNYEISSIILLIYIKANSKYIRFICKTIKNIRP